ncbi:MAG: 6-phosphogluconolactonase [Verrucomicrobiales bacterium]|nr:6-phosphogluconolactonase [Verrucomicrobiales bacterium]
MEAEVTKTDNFFDDATYWIARKIVDAQRDGGIFRLSLCGGSTPAPIYEALAAREDIDWERVLITFGDERTVPPEDEQSNYRMVKASLLDPAGVPAANVIRMCGELEPAEAAERCEGQLKKLAQIAGEEIFVHDLILLGMGDDGHTASLFPETEALKEEERWVVENFVPKFDTYRITFTYPLIKAAKEVLFLVNGAAKHEMAENVLAGKPEYPSSAIEAEKVFWLIGG